MRSRRLSPSAAFFAVLALLFPALALAQAAVGAAAPGAQSTVVQIKALYFAYAPAIFTALYFAAQAVAHIASPTSTVYKLADWFLTGPARALVPPSATGQQNTTAPKAGGFVRIGLLAVVAALAIILTGCAWLKASSVSGSVDGKQANVTLTAPDGTPYVVTVANQTACLSSSAFVSLGSSNLECQGACAQRVAGGGTITVYCRVKGTTQAFPLQIPVPL